MVCIWTIEGLPGWIIIIDILDYTLYNGMFTIGDGHYLDDSSSVPFLLLEKCNTLETVSSTESSVWIRVVSNDLLSTKMRLRQGESWAGKNNNCLKISQGL